MNLFKSNADLPKAVQAALPADAQSIFRKTFNAHKADDAELSEVALFQHAWMAVSDKGWCVGDDGVWVKDAQSAASTVSVHQKIAFDDGMQARRTGDGYLVAMPRVARSGIQLYSGDEMGRPGMPVVRVYRPETEIFSADSLRSYAHKPMTNDHPPELVSADNWSKYAVGEIGEEVIRDGQFVRVPMILMDGDAIRDVANGKKELSLGYTMDLKWQSGKVPGTDEIYDAVQMNVRANHLAVVDAARGGPQLRIGDDQPGELHMATRKITVDSIDLQIEDKDAQIIERHIAKLTADLATAAAALKTATDAITLRDSQISEAKKASDTKDAEVATLKQQLKDAEVTPAKLDALVKDRGVVVEKARKLIGDKLVVDNKSIDDVRRQVVDLRMGAVAKDWSVDQIAASFASFADAPGTSPAGTVLDRVINAGVQPVANDQAVIDKAYEDGVKVMESAWKTPVSSH